MKVNVQYLGLAKTYTRKPQDSLILTEGSSLADLLNKLAEKYGKPFTPEIYDPAEQEVKPTFTVMVNGVIMGQLNGINTKLKNDDKIVLMPLMTGG